MRVMVTGFCTYKRTYNIVFAFDQKINHSIIFFKLLVHFQIKTFALVIFSLYVGIESDRKWKGWKCLSIFTIMVHRDKFCVFPKQQLIIGVLWSRSLNIPINLINIIIAIMHLLLNNEYQFNILMVN